jgi:hypothetical protein
MNINKLMPTVMGIIIITLLALATSCTTTNKLVNNNAGHYGINPHVCPAYN